MYVCEYGYVCRYDDDCFVYVLFIDCMLELLCYGLGLDD